MLFSRKTGQRLKPMGVMSCSFFNGPFLDGSSYYVSNSRIQFFSSFDGLFQFFVHTLWQTVFHDCVIKYVLTKHL